MNPSPNATWKPCQACNQSGVETIYSERSKKHDLKVTCRYCKGRKGEWR